ncbi:MAG: sigma 54-interacting transcriptional regulator [Deltaproteobacteria bacterium]|nr:sigma 54-interacting transcriptional regulator [Deltaproteobacteria bacterium]
MRASELDLGALLSLNPRGGVIRFGGQRALLLDAVALGILRKELIETIGTLAARGVLFRFGYAHGWRTAEALKHEFPWDSEREWRTAGGRLHELQGLVVVEPAERPVTGSNPPFAEAAWHESYEAEQHLLHLGLSQEPTCWSLTGFASGYLSYCNGREILCVEVRCRGRGDATCHLVGRPRDEWGEEVVGVSPQCRKESLDATLAKVTAELKKAERRLMRRRRELVRAMGQVEAPSGIVARSAAMKRVVDLARRVAKVDSTVLITGESGVGKERIARLIHEESRRTAGPFVALNCGAVAESLLESELFGHARGAFTGAAHDRPGLFEAASGGTLLLDEIAELSPAMQVKLLRALQEREVRRVGENKSRPVDVRVLAATNRDLSHELAVGRFRSDLLYRLRVVELQVPPLRERREDILPIARWILSDVARRTGRKVTGISAGVADQLPRYPWPGNVRELANAMERAVVLATGHVVEVHDLPEEVRLAAGMQGAISPGRALAEVERQHILATLEASGGNHAKTAALLGIGKATLYRKLRGYGRG